MSHPYMPLYVSDYLGDTSHLTTVEHGAYMLLIMTYWQRGKPLPAESDRLANIARMPIADWLKVEPTIAEFFAVDDGAWTHARIDRDLAKARSRSEKARESGKASAERRGSERSTNVEPQARERSTNVQLYPSSSLSLNKIPVSNLSTEQEPARAEPDARPARKQGFKLDLKGGGARSMRAGPDRLAKLRASADGFGLETERLWAATEQRHPENPYGYFRKLCVDELRVWLPTAADAVLIAALKGEDAARKLVFEAMTTGSRA